MGHVGQRGVTVLLKTSPAVNSQIGYSDKRCRLFLANVNDDDEHKTKHAAECFPQKITTSSTTDNEEPL